MLGYPEKIMGMGYIDNNINNKKKRNDKINNNMTKMEKYFSWV